MFFVTGRLAQVLQEEPTKLIHRLGHVRLEVIQIEVTSLRDEMELLWALLVGVQLLARPAVRSHAGR